jgi:hypothetical protein
MGESQERERVKGLEQRFEDEVRPLSLAGMMLHATVANRPVYAHEILFYLPGKEAPASKSRDYQADRRIHAKSPETFLQALRREPMHATEAGDANRDEAAEGCGPTGCRVLP